MSSVGQGYDIRDLTVIVVVVEFAHSIIFTGP